MAACICSPVLRYSSLPSVRILMDICSVFLVISIDSSHLVLRIMGFAEDLSTPRPDNISAPLSHGLEFATGDTT